MRRVRLAVFTLSILLCSYLSTPPAEAQKRGTAKNVIVFLADAGGVPTINAASLLGYNEPQKLYVQSWPNIGLSDTSTASQWVTDSAAGMSAIVTGQKTHNGVISQGADTVRGKQDGTPTKTVLEYAEERGLATGVVSNMNIADATPAACYAHANDRGKFGEIFLQVFNPRFGDGVDVVIGAGRRQIFPAVEALGQNLDQLAAKHNRPIYASLADVPADARRPIVVADGDIDVAESARRALRTLSANPNGYFLMVEWDAHTDNPAEGLQNLVNLDRLIREIAGQVNRDETLLLFTADHSFDLRTHGGTHQDSVLKGYEEWRQQHTPNEEIQLPVLRVGHSHTGEEVLAAALGPGSEALRGFFPNTQLFQLMMDAWGWQVDR